MTNAHVRLRQLPEAGRWAWWFAGLTVVSAAAVGHAAASGAIVWTAVLVSSVLVNLYALDRELREVRA